MKDVSAKWIKIILSLLVLAGIIVFLTSIAGFVKRFVIAALLAYILDPLASYLEARRLTRLTATAIIFLGISLLITVFIIIFLPHITSELEAVNSGLSTEKATEIIDKIDAFIENNFSFLGVQELNINDKLHQYVLSTGEKMFGFFLNAVSFLSNLIIIPFIMFFLLKDAPEMKRLFVSLIPNRYFEFTLTLIYKTDVQLGNYLRGQFVESLIVASLAMIALATLDVRYFIILSVFAGLANLIPYIGPIVGAVPAVVVAVLKTGDLTLALYVALAFLIIQIIDNVVLKPVVVAKSVNIHPLVVLIAVIVGGKFFGILGMLVSVPVAGILKVIGQETYANLRKYHLA